MSKILIIEDEEAIADLEKDYLELSGFQVEIEHEGDKGLERAMTSEYDLIILDLMLPGLSGEKVLAHAVKIPVIVVSAKEDYNNLLLQHFCWALYSSMGFPMIPDFC